MKSPAAEPRSVTLLRLPPLQHTEAMAARTTLDRGLVHRSAVSEVFLTDIRRTGETTTRAAAQLPGCHGFFGDHRGSRDIVDPMLLLEIARQATIASAHMLDVPQATVLISRNFAITLPDGPLPYSGDAPLEVTIESSFEWQAFRGKRPRAGLCRQTIFLGKTPVAEHWSDGQLMSRDQLAALREAQRGSPPAWTSDQAPRLPCTTLAPEQAGRWNPLNVVLKDSTRGDDCTCATLAPPWQNRALFDHGYDHLTMQLLSEAARQVATLDRRQWEADLDSRAITGVSGRFSQFAEVDAAVYLRACAGSDPQVQGVTIWQAAAAVAEIDITFAPSLSGGAAG